MFTDLVRRFRWFALSSLIACSSPMAGCAGAVGSDTFDEEGISDVDHSDVKRQSIGNCWIYAQASWLESVHKSASGEVLNVSESYWSYWHWFDQITAGWVSDEVSTGGNWSTSGSIIRRYGVINEGDFIADEATAEISYRQSSALAAINASIKTGALKDAAARKDKALVRAELDKAFQLAPAVVAQLDQVFGKDVARNLTTKDRASGAFAASTDGTAIKRALDLSARYSPGPDQAPVVRTVEDGLAAWRQVSYPSNETGVRDFDRRWQKALHDNQPVVISWFVDFNALDSQGRFFAPPATPGHQGGHMTVMEDYQAEVPGVGTFKAGELVRDPAVKAQLLGDDVKIEFIRIKNSWGNYRSDRMFVLPGYHDLYMSYLRGPIKHCPETYTNVSECYDDVPFNDIVLPPNY